MTYTDISDSLRPPRSLAPSSYPELRIFNVPYTYLTPPRLLYLLYAYAGILSLGFDGFYKHYRRVFLSPWTTSYVLSCGTVDGQQADGDENYALTVRI